MAISFDEQYDELLAREVATHNAKRADYTGGGDPMANYRNAANFMGLSVGQVLLTRMAEKVYRLRVLQDKREVAVKNESVEDTCVDISVIAKLFAIWYSHE